MVLLGLVFHPGATTVIRSLIKTHMFTQSLRYTVNHKIMFNQSPDEYNKICIYFGTLNRKFKSSIKQQHPYTYSQFQVTGYCL